MKKKKLAIVVGALVVAIAVLVISLNYNTLFWTEKNIKLDKDYNQLFSSEEMKEKDLGKRISDYATTDSICYENEDGKKSLFVYSSAIQYLNSQNKLELIDSRITNVNDEAKRKDDYIYTVANNDIKVFYPKTLSQKKGVLLDYDISYELGLDADNEALGWYQEKENFIGQKKAMIVYKKVIAENDISFYPSAIGTNCEIKLNKDIRSDELAIRVKFPNNDLILEETPGGYLKINRKNNKDGNEVGLIEKPIIKDKNGNISDDSSIEIKTLGSEEYLLTFNIGDSFCKKGTSLFISFEMRRSNQPDNALYSKLPDLTYAYLRNYSVIGNSAKYGYGRAMIRYKFTNAFGLNSSDIEKANYYTYSLDKPKSDYEMLSVLEDWCSLTGNWNNNYKTGDRVSLFSEKSNEMKFDITDEVKKWCDDPSGQLEHNGVQLKSVNEEEGECNVILSNDSTLFNNVTEIILDQ